jgi:hypothetical protein
MIVKPPANGPSVLATTWNFGWIFGSSWIMISSSAG